MSKYTFVGGDIIKKIGGRSLTFAKGDIINEGSEVIQKGKEGVFYGKPGDPPLLSKFFIEGYWASDEQGNNPITTAELGDKVYFIIKFKNVLPTIETIKFELCKLVNQHFKWSGFLLLYFSERGDNIKTIKIVTDEEGNEEEKIYEEEKITNMQTVIPLTISKTGKIQSLLKKEKEANLFFWIKYDYEKKRLPEKKENYLVVNRPKKEDGLLILVQASKEHLLPELYDAETGDQWIVNIIEEAKEINKEITEPFTKNAMYGNKIKKLSSTTNEANAMEKRMYKKVVERLGKGELITNKGTTTSTTRIVLKKIYEIDNKFVEKIPVGVNKGNFEPGVTTKGINQFDATLHKGASGFKMKIINVSKIGGDLVSVATMMKDVANGDQMDIPFMPPFVPMIVDQQIAEMNEENHENFLVKLNIAKATGNIETIQSLFSRNAEEIRKGYDLIFVSDDDLDKILENKKRFKNDLYYQKKWDKRNFSNGLIIEYKEIKDEYGREIFVYYIHAIYLNDFFENN